MSLKEFTCKTTLPNGKILELYSTKYLADALGRSPHTIRKWEISGILPETCFKDSKGFRLYSQEHIQAAYRIAEEVKLPQSGKQNNPIHRYGFPKKCFEAFAELQKKYLGE